VGTDSSVKLERLSIAEVSGVDDPANEAPGWMVQKSKASATTYPIGPDETWDVGAAEKRVRKVTGATDAPNAKYAACFLYKSGDGTKFGDYKFLACDDVDGNLSVMPGAIRAAATLVSKSSLSDSEKATVQATITKLESKPGIATKGAEDATTILGRIKKVLSATPTEEIDMTSEELTAQLDERLAPLVALGEKVDTLSKAVEDAQAGAPAAIEKIEPSTDEATAAADARVAKAIEVGVTAGIEKGLEPYNDILDAVLNRVAGVEKYLAFETRKSLTGQEGESGEGEQEATPTVGDAIAKALRHPTVSAA
jgi:hypothetical protein